MGVLNRVEALADRGEPRGGQARRPFESLLSLSEIISQAVGVGLGSKKVAGVYSQMVGELGPELEILRRVEPEAIEKTAGPVVAEGIVRVRAGRVEALGGFDGEFGKLSLFGPDELAEINRQGRLFKVGQAPQKKAPAVPAPKPKPPRTPWVFSPTWSPCPPASGRTRTRRRR